MQPTSHLVHSLTHVHLPGNPWHEQSSKTCEIELLDSVIIQNYSEIKISETISCPNYQKDKWKYKSIL